VCQACGVGCSIAPQLLHLHFEDGDPTHTDRSNLYMLCVDCHAHQPGHDHMKIQPIVQADIEGVQLLRAQQRIVSLKHVRTLTPSTFNALLG
jgi:5-methylcytosine-specific restriction endonuclease McrA